MFEFLIRLCRNFIIHRVLHEVFLICLSSLLWQSWYHYFGCKFHMHWLVFWFKMLVWAESFIFLFFVYFLKIFNDRILAFNKEKYLRHMSLSACYTCYIIWIILFCMLTLIFNFRAFVIKKNKTKTKLI